MRYTRRQVLKFAAATPVLGLLSQAGCGNGDDGSSSAEDLPVYTYEGEPGPENLFQHGVASGDPMPDAVILWTRVTPDSAEPVEVFWEIARDEGFLRRVGAGYLTTNAERDFTVKIDVGALQPGNTYYYRFQSLGRSSLVGRTRTAPNGATDALRLAVVSCSSLAHGYFHSYRRLAPRTDLDCVVHLGDYIYEYGNGEYGDVRDYEPPHEILTLADYRARYGQYRRDPDLQALHQLHPFIGVWDDHEAANNSYAEGAENHTEGAEGAWTTRRGIAERVYSEWMPIRDQSDGRVYRNFKFGDLVDLVMLDTRLSGRDLQAPFPSDVAIINDPERTLLGFEQEAWLEDQLRTSTAQWCLVGQQVVFGQIKIMGAPNSEGGGMILNTDQWDGYAPARQRVLDLLREAELSNVVVLSGDIHSSGAAELNDDPNNPEAYDPESGAGSLGVEFVTPGITSPAFAPGSNETLVPIILAENPHIKYANIEDRGYLIVDVTRAKVRAQWYHTIGVENAEAEEVTGPVFACLDGTRRLITES